MRCARESAKASSGSYRLKGREGTEGKNILHYEHGVSVLSQLECSRMGMPIGLLQPVQAQMYFKRFILGRDRGPSDCCARRAPALLSHATPLRGRTHHLSVSAAAKRQQLASSFWCPKVSRKSGDVDCSPRGAQPPRCPRRLRARPVVWRCSAVLVDPSRGRRCIGDGRAR